MPISPRSSRQTTSDTDDIRSDAGSEAGLDLDVHFLLLETSEVMSSVAEAARRIDGCRVELLSEADEASLEHLLCNCEVDVVAFEAEVGWPNEQNLVRTIARCRPFCGTVLVTDPDDPKALQQSMCADIDARLPETSSLEELEILLPWVVRRAIERARTRVVRNKIDDSGFQGMICFDRDLQIQYYNRRAELNLQHLDLEETLSIGEEGRELLNDVLPDFEEGCRTAFEGKSRTVQAALSNEENSQHVECIYEPIGACDENEPAGVCVGLQDVSSRYRAEARAEEFESMFWAFVDALPAGVTVLDTDGSIIRANEAFRSFLEADGDLQGRMLTSLLPDDEVEPKTDEFDEIVEGTRRIAKFERRYRRSDGELVWGDVVEMALPGVDGPRCIIDVVTDVTKRKQLEREIEQAERMRALGQLAGGVAHDFNNLLSIIMSYTHLLERSFSQEGEVAEYIAKIFETAERGSRLANQLLAFGRCRSSEATILQLNEVIREVAEMLECLIPEDIAMELELEECTPMIRADRRQIEQVLMNLALNARDAMPNGGTLTIETHCAPEKGDEQSMSIEAESGVELVVRDDGCGMDEATLERIFEPFFTTKDRGRGTGLGLSTVYGIVEQHDGDIHVESEPGEGTTFVMWFPAEAVEPEEESVELESETLSGDETILVVEDDESLRTPIRTVLEQHGYTVLDAADTDEALALVHEWEEPIDLLLSDLVVPETNGAHLAEDLTRDHSELRVLLMSGYSGDVVDERAPSDIDWPILEKPITMETLCHEVRDALDDEAT